MMAMSTQISQSEEFILAGSTIRTRILQNKRTVGFAYFMIGEDLWNIKQEYLNSPDTAIPKYQYPNFTAFYEASEEAEGLGMSQSSVNRAIRVYLKFVVELEIQPHAVLDSVDYSKLDKLCQVATPDNIQSWLDQARVLERPKFDRLVDQYKKDNPDLKGDVPEVPIGTVQDARFLTAKEWYQMFKNFDEWLLKIFMRKSIENEKAGEEVRQMLQTLIKLQ